MEISRHWKVRWSAIALLALPTLIFLGHSLIHPGQTVKGNPILPGQSATPPAASIPWTQQASGTSASLRGVYNVDGKTAWASGSNGTILRTTDGGAHWTACATPPDAQTLDFRGIQAWDAEIAIVMSSGPGDKSRVYRTTDGGKSWILILKNPDTPDGFFDSFYADWSEEGGIARWIGSVLGDPVKGSFVLLDTADSGATWVPRRSPTLALGDTTLAGFAASNSLFPGSQDQVHNSHLFATGGKSGAFVWIEKAWTPGSQQQTWRRIPVPIGVPAESAGIFSIASHSDSEAFRTTISRHESLVAVGGDYTKPGEAAATAARSGDDGLTWHAAAKPPHGYRSAVAFSPELNAWIAVGANGSDISRDDGNTWQPLDNESWNALSLPFAVGPKGRIARLSNAAAKATAQSS